MPNFTEQVLKTRQAMTTKLLTVVRSVEAHSKPIAEQTDRQTTPNLNRIRKSRSRSRSTRSISAAREVEGARGGVLGQGFCVLRGSFARCFAEVAALFALSGEAGAVNMRGVKRFSMRVR